MKKGIIIGGVVLVIGGVSYFLYMKEKRKEQGLIAENQPASPTTEVTTTTSVNSQIPPLPTGGIVSSSTTLMSIEEQNKLDKARDIFEKIKRDMSASTAYQRMSDNFKNQMSFTTTRTNPFSSNPYPSQINKLKDDLLQLGYEIKGTTNPVLVKLNSL